MAIELLKNMLMEETEMMKVFYVFRNLVNTVQLCTLVNEEAESLDSVYY